MASDSFISQTDLQHVFASRGVSSDKHAYQPERGQPEYAETVSFVRDVEAAAWLPAKVRAEDAVSATALGMGECLGEAALQHMLSILTSGVRKLFDHPPADEKSPRERLNGPAFIARVARGLDIDTITAESIIKGVWRVLRARLPERQVDELAQQLPPDLQRLWLEAAPGLALPSGAEPTPPSINFMVTAIERARDLPVHVDGVQALAAVLTALTDVLDDYDLRLAAASLPIALRPVVLYDSALIEGEGDNFVRDVASRLETEHETALYILARVFSVLQLVLPAQLVVRIARQLPDEAAKLWRERARLSGALPAAPRALADAGERL
ncbi:MAG TPA: DUF2267 domain-containing protein [Polyangiaceae bacterium]|nr:DUF2267 domain-containing protein [Polyangiaceae bacterium]